MTDSEGGFYAPCYNKAMFLSPAVVYAKVSKRVHGVFYGWWLTGVVLLVLTLTSLVVFQGLGIFLVALERQFGWSRAALSGAFSLGRAQGALMGPIEGFLIDRFGPRRMVLIGYTVMGIGFILFSFVQELWQFYGAFFVITMGAGLGSWLPMISAVNNWFLRRRALAMSIAMSGTHIGGFLVPAMALGIDSHGFEKVTLGIGIILIAIALPVSRFMRGSPEEYGLLPDGDSAESRSTHSKASPASSTPEADFTVRQALRTRAFWCIATAHIASAVPLVTIAIHLVPKLTDPPGLSLSMAGVVVATFTATALPAQFLAGYLGDRLPKPRLISGFLVLQGVSLVMIATTDAIHWAFIFAALFGIAFGGRLPLLFSIRGDYFGRKAFATITGISQFPSNLLMIVAPLFAGYMFDKTQSYFVPFITIAGISFLGSVLILLAKKPRLAQTPEVVAAE